MKEIIGRKIGMTSVFATDGTMYPVTVMKLVKASQLMSLKLAKSSM